MNLFALLGVRARRCAEEAPQEDYLVSSEIHLWEQLHLSEDSSERGSTSGGTKAESSLGWDETTLASKHFAYRGKRCHSYPL